MDLQPAIAAEEYSILKALGKLGILSAGQIAKLCCGDDRTKTYRILYSLQSKGLVNTATVSGKYREKYIKLSADGAKKLELDELRYIRPQFAATILATNDIYINLISAGFQPEELLSRLEIDKVFNVDLRATSANLVLHRKKRPLVAYYVRRPNLRLVLLKRLFKCGRDNAWHFIVYQDKKLLSKDARVLAAEALPPRVCLVPANEVAKFSLAKVEDNFASVARELMEYFAPGGKLKELDPLAPCEYGWERPGKGSALLADMRYNDISLAAALRNCSLNQLKSNGWGDLVVLFCMDETHAARWVQLAGAHDWMWAITVNHPTLYRVRDGKLEIAKT